MVALSRVALQQEWNQFLVNNLTGDIQASEMLSRMTDFVDSVEFLTPVTTTVPRVASLSIQGVATAVDPGTSLSGTLTFQYNVSPSANVQGDMTLSQNNPAATLATDIKADENSIAVAVQSITLVAGASVVFTLAGTATAAAGGAAFSRDFTVRARSLDEYMYIGIQPDTVLNPPVPGLTVLDYPFAGNRQNLVIPTFSGSVGQHLVISQKASEPQIRQIILGGVDQFAAFTRTANAYVVNSENFDAYVSNNPLLGDAVSNNIITVVR